jgi:hypothetical protein
MALAAVVVEAVARAVLRARARVRVRCILFLETHLSIKHSHRILIYNRCNILFFTMLYFVA